MARLLTKKEFLKEFKYKNARSFSRLVKDGKIILDENGIFDERNTVNKKWVREREKKLAKQIKKTTTPKQKTPQKSSDQLSLEIDILNAKLEDISNRSELTKIKIQKEKREVVETSLLNKVIKYAFQEMMQSLTEFPSVCANEIIELVQAEKEPKEALVKYLTTNITAIIKAGLENARTAAKKYYDDK